MQKTSHHRIEGRSACFGVATGRPCIIRNTYDLDNVAVGDILVAVETDISYVPAMLRAAAVVTESGGRFCHAAVWARENRKPAILQAENATTILDNKQIICVNATIGAIEWEEQHE